MHNSISLLLSLLRRTARFPLPVDTLKSSSSASLTGAHTATLDFSELAVLARLGDTTTGDEIEGRDSSYGRVGELLELSSLAVLLIVVWHGDGGGHRGGDGGWDGGRVGSLIVVVLVNSEVERVLDWDAHSLSWLGDRVTDRLWNRDGSGGDGWTNELYNLKIRYREDTYEVHEGTRKSRT